MLALAPALLSRAQRSSDLDRYDTRHSFQASQSFDEAQLLSSHPFSASCLRMIDAGAAVTLLALMFECFSMEAETV
jgi:hypothetical protein